MVSLELFDVVVEFSVFEIVAIITTITAIITTIIAILNYQKKKKIANLSILTTALLLFNL